MAGESAVVGILRVLLQAETADYVAGVKDAEKTTASLSRSFGNLARDLSGAKITEKALDVAKALQQVGGVSKLTARELASVSATVTAATDKLTRMGKEVPPEIAKLSAEIQKVNTATPAAAGGVTQLGTAFGKLQSLAPILTVAGLSTAVIGLAKAAMDTADQVVTLSNKTGISTEGIQRMQYVAEQTGTSLETLTSASFKLGVNISEGTDKARTAVSALGLSFETLKTQTPEQQFATVVQALEGVEDTTERNRLGVALFGKGFADMAGAVSEGMTQIGADATVMSDETVRSLEAAGDAWEKFKRQLMIGVGETAGAFITAIDHIERGADSLTNLEKLKLLGTTGTGYLQALAEIGKTEAALEKDREAAATAAAKATAKTATATADYSAQLATAKAEVKDLSAAQRTQLNAALALGGDAAKAYAESIDLSDAALGFYQDGQRNAAASTKTHTAEMRRQAAAAEALATRFKESVKVFNVFDNLGTTFRAPIESAGEAAAQLGASLADLPSDAALAQTTFAQFAPTLVDAREEIAGIRAEAWTIGKGFEQAFGNIAARLPDVLMGAFQGGGDIGKSLGGLVGGSFAGAFSKPVGDFLSKSLGKTLGGALGNLLPGLGTLLGGLAGGLADKVMGKLFKSEGKSTNNVRDQFTAAMGGIDALVGKLEAAGAGGLMKKFYDAKTLQEFAAVQKEIDAALGQHTADLGRAQEVAEKYGITLEEMGQGFKQKQTDTGAATFLDDIRVMQEAGVSTDTIIAKTGDELAAFILEAKRLGTEVPKELEPFVAKMIEMGTLSVTNQEQLAAATEKRKGLEAELAEAMTDSSETGVAKQKELAAAIAATDLEAQNATTSITEIGEVPFAETMQEQFKGVMTAITDLITVLTDGIIGGFEKGADQGTGVLSGKLGRYRPPPIKVPIEFEGEYPGGGTTTTVPAMAAGGMVTRPTLALIGESGPELVTPLDQVGRLGGGGVGRADLQGMVDGFARTVTRQVDRLEEVIAITVRDVRAGAY